MASMTYTVGGTDNLVSFKSAARVPIESLKVYFSPIQEGEGDPSPENVRNIIGWEEVEIYMSLNSISIPSAVIPVTFPSEAETLYGGYIDYINGTLIKKYHLINGGVTNTFTANSITTITQLNDTYVRFWLYVAGPARKTGTTFKCNMLPSNDIAGYANYEVAKNISGAADTYLNSIWCIMPISAVGTTKESISAYLNTNHFSYVYEMAEPQTYQLDPHSLKTYIGQNNIWSDTNGVSEVSYEIYDSTLIREAKKRIAASIHPAGYQRVRSIKTSGTKSPIDLNRLFDSTHRYVIEVNFTNCGSVELMFFGARGQATYYPINSGYTNYGNYKLTFYGGVTLVSNTAPSYNAESTWTEWHHLNVKPIESTFTIYNSSGEYTIGPSKMMETTHYTSQNNIYLFGCHYPNDSTIPTFRGSIRLFEEYDENDTIISRLIPCKRLSDNIYGMYDEIQHIFYTTNYDPFTIGV